jgi:1-acyl-sn-glycerol-3-phosphate acyltransferase
MNWLRTILYQIVFYSGSVLIVLAVPLVAPFGQKATIHHAHRWARLNRWAARVFLGVTTRVEGEIPEGQFLFAAKHQSMYETTELQLILGGPAMVLKRELSRIPLWGWATKLYGSMSVDREASAKALRRLMAEGKELRARAKRAGHMPAKMRFLAAQAEAMLEGGLWLDLSRHANAMAQKLAAVFRDCRPRPRLAMSGRHRVVFAMPPAAQGTVYSAPGIR